MKKYFILIILVMSMITGWGQGIKTEGTKIVDQNGQQLILRGMGLGGWMLMEGYMMQSGDVADTQHEFRNKLTDLIGEEKTNEFFDSWLANFVTKADIDSLAGWGFNSVRLPLHYNLFTLPIEEEPVPGENTWLDKGFTIVDSVMQWCNANHIYLILDLHAAPGGQGENAAISDYDPTKPSLWESQDNRDKTVALWQKLADRYKDEPWLGGYDLLNEVNWNLSGNVMLRNLYEEITGVIRAVDTNHIIFIEGNWFANDFTGLTPPWDDNMVYSFHKYWNYNDQGSVDWVLQISQQYDLPLWMGEGGENSNVWYHDAIKLLEDNDIGWSFWPMKRIETIVGQYSILYTDGYKAVLNYWKGQGPQPTVDEAYTAMMELANNSNSIHCLYRKDVHDAQIRQINSDEIIPYSPHTIPGIVYMPDFDLGPLNHAYYDVDNVSYSMSTGNFEAWNSGWSYRNDGVDIEPNNDPVNSNGFHIGFVNKDEWTKYTVQILEAGAYTAKARVASQDNGGLFHLALDDEDITPTQTVSSTSGWTDFTDLEIPDVLLNQGEHKISFWIDGNTAFNISSIEFIKTGSIDSVNVKAVNGHTGADEKSIEISCNQDLLAESIIGTDNHFSVFVNGDERAFTSIKTDSLKPRTIIFQFEDYLVYTDDILINYDGTSIVSLTGKQLDPFSDLMIRNTLPKRNILPKKIQAEDYTAMVGLGIEETTDLGGGYNIGYTNTGDYADYLIYSPGNSNYKIQVRVAAKNAAGSFGFYLIDENQVETQLCIVNTPVTGGWQTWETIEVQVSIPKGAYTLRMRVISQEFNLNWYKFQLVAAVDENLYQSRPQPSVYPMPVENDQVFIDFGPMKQEHVQVDIFDLLGTRLSSKIYALKNSIATINVAGLPKGVYILKSHLNNYTLSNKIILQ